MSASPGSRYEPSRTFTRFTVGCPAAGSETSRPSSPSWPIRIGTSTTVRTSVEATPAVAAACSANLATSPPSTVRSANRNSVNVRW
jgi:hypothetical protein